MALIKQPVSLSFNQGVQTKTDPFQIPIGQFANLQNVVFTKDGLLQKRNGFGLVTNTTDGSTTLATLNDGLVLLGSRCKSYNADTKQLIDAGLFQPLDLSTTSIVRRATSQLTCDTAIASNGMAITTWMDSNGGTYYQISDSDDGQILVPAVALENTATMSRVFVVGNFFIVTYLVTSGTTHLKYICIPIMQPSVPGSPVDISSQASSLTAAYDAYVYNNKLYIALNCSDGGGAIRVWSISASHLSAGTVGAASTTVATANLLSIIVNSTNPSALVIWVAYYDGANIKAFALNSNFTVALAPTLITAGITANQITTSFSGTTLEAIYEVQNSYGYTPSPPEASDTKTDYIEYNTLTLPGVAGTPTKVLRGVGIASKAIISSSLNETVLLATYGQQLQPTYFLIDLNGNVLARLAYSNGGGYLANQIQPQINQDSTGILRMAYLFSDLLQAVNKTQGNSISGVYAQKGINVASFDFDSTIQALEIGGSLSISGGMLWQYDGVKARELGFNVYPEDIAATWSATGGSIHAQPSGVINTNAYFYQVTYEWTDAAGQIHRSAPSIPVAVTTTGSGTAGSITLNIATLRQTYKTDNKVRIVIYRWSVGQQTYYRVTSINTPLLNDPSVDSVTYVDTLADSSIVGNDIIYTNGGVIEDIAAPGSMAMTLWQSRLFLVDAEDRNLIWFSKQVIENTPVEMSDLLTIYVAPTTGAQGSTGPITALSSMDDKLVVFKRDAIYYIGGVGPDNTGANNQFSDPVFITGTVGCINQKSIVLTPNGVMFQSDKGIWLLGRDLSTTYIGAAVESYTQDQTVTSALCIPGTNQVRFTLGDKTAVMYDYFFNRWSNWANINALSSVVWNELHTYLNPFEQVVQETPNQYIDISSPVTWQITTGWINLAGLQGFERFYEAYLLGVYYTPFKLNVEIAYDYNASARQSIILIPDNATPNYGGEAAWGTGGPWGGPGNIFEERFFPKKQKCESFQVTITEIYDASLGVTPGNGLTLSGMNLIIGQKRGFRTQSAKRSFG